MASAPRIQAALVALGLLASGEEIWHLGLHTSVNRALAVIVHLGGFVAAGWIVRRLLTTLASLLELLAASGEATARLAAAADRIAESLARVPADAAPAAPPSPTTAPAPVPAVPPADTRTMALAEIRVALRHGDWVQAESMLQSFSDMHPGDPVSAALGAELKAAREAAVSALRARLDAARDANDLDRVLELREPLRPLLDSETLATLDRRLAKWFMALIQKRMRQGAMTKDIALLATQVAGAFDATPEGASLRAALPTLRRSVGLCARCGQPYTGIADACPTCLAGSPFPIPVPPVAPPSHSNGGPAQFPGPAPSETTVPEPD